MGVQRVRGEVLATTLGILVASSSTAQQSASIELLFTGTFYELARYPASGERWLAANRTDSGIVFEETTIEVTEVTQPCTGTATAIAATKINDPLFMVRGSPLLQPGPLKTAFDGNRFIYPAERVSLQLAPDQHFGFRAFGSATPAVGEVVVADYRIVMNLGNRVQTLAEFNRIDWDGPPKLIWAGDLDHDEKPDALLDLTTSYASNRYVLFISSAAGEGQLVERVAEFFIAGC